MYVPKQQLREHREDDETRKLVFYVPAGAMVRVTSAPLVVETEAAQEHEVIDMRRGLMLLETVSKSIDKCCVNTT